MKVPTYLLPAERDELLSVVADHPRDRAIVTLFLYAGLRLAELCALDWADVEVARRTIHVGGPRARLVGLHREVEEAVRAYLDARNRFADFEAELGFPLYQHPVLFLSSRSQRINWRTVEQLLDRYTARCSFGASRRITPTVLRDTFARDLLATGADPHRVAQVLGLASVARYR